MRNFRHVTTSLKLLRRFYERLGWRDKVSDTDSEFFRAFEEARRCGIVE